MQTAGILRVIDPQMFPLSLEQRSVKGFCPAILPHFKIQQPQIILASGVFGMILPKNHLKLIQRCQVKGFGQFVPTLLRKDIGHVKKAVANVFIEMIAQIFLKRPRLLVKKVGWEQVAIRSVNEGEVENRSGPSCLPSLFHLLINAEAIQIPLGSIGQLSLEMQNAAVVKTGVCKGYRYFSKICQGQLLRDEIEGHRLL